MKLSILITFIIFTCSCTHISLNQLVRDANSGCSAPNHYCTPELVVVASLDTLKTNKSSIKVQCDYTPLIDESYRDGCVQSLSQMANTISLQWAGSLSPVTLVSAKYEESHICIDSYVPGRELADCNFYYITATIPLSWLKD